MTTTRTIIVSSLALCAGLMIAAVVVSAVLDKMQKDEDHSAYYEDSTKIFPVDPPESHA